MAPRVAIVVPAYNESATIASVVTTITQYGTPIVVDDGSTDETAVVAVNSGALVVSEGINLGYDGALQRGFEEAQNMGFDIVVTFDADGQHDASILALIIRPLITGRSELVIGIRPKPARIAEAAFNFYCRVRYGVPDILCGLKGYHMSLYRRHGRFDSLGSIGTELALASLRNGVSHEQISVPVHPRSDAPRFGSALRANLRILRALALCLAADVKTKRKF